MNHNETGLEGWTGFMWLMMDIVTKHLLHKIVYIF
jgi:hypothetical protein